nr:MAG TPA: hypothetical protein [Caudoviricetes sp.]
MFLYFNFNIYYYSLLFFYDCIPAYYAVVCTRIFFIAVLYIYYMFCIAHRIAHKGNKSIV